MPVRILALDGHGGAGKTTIAAELARLLDDAPVIHIDDFTTGNPQVAWWPRLRTQVLDPLASGQAAHYQRYDWDTRALAEWHTVPAHPHIILEGVRSTRREFHPYLTLRVWVHTPRDICLRRGLARDGAAALPQWQQWMAAEDLYIAREKPHRSAELVVDGTGG